MPHRPFVSYVAGTINTTQLTEIRMSISGSVFQGILWCFPLFCLRLLPKLSRLAEVGGRSYALLFVSFLLLLSRPSSPGWGEAWAVNGQEKRLSGVLSLPESPTVQPHAVYQRPETTTHCSTR